MSAEASFKAGLARPIPEAFADVAGIRMVTPVGGRRKRFMDILIAVIAIVLLAPLMAAIALLIRIRMGGPVIFGHERVGVGGRSFSCLKFRTMVADADAVLARHLAENPAAAAEWHATRKLRNDPRITSLGRALRLSSLDELPQFFNVLRGEMSCVGPRPVVAEELERYGTLAGDYIRAVPGITGLWQVSGRSTLGYAERVALDSDYVRRWSLWRDIVIILRTVPAVVQFRRAA